MLYTPLLCLETRQCRLQFLIHGGCSGLASVEVFVQMKVDFSSSQCELTNNCRGFLLNGFTVNHFLSTQSTLPYPYRSDRIGLDPWHVYVSHSGHNTGIANTPNLVVEQYWSSCLLVIVRVALLPPPRSTLTMSNSFLPSPPPQAEPWSADG
jgi:hypothetical protein